MNTIFQCKDADGDMVVVDRCKSMTGPKLKVSVVFGEDDCFDDIGEAYVNLTQVRTLHEALGKWLEEQEKA